MRFPWGKNWLEIDSFLIKWKNTIRITCTTAARLAIKSFAKIIEDDKRCACQMLRYQSRLSTDPSHPMQSTKIYENGIFRMEKHVGRLFIRHRIWKCNLRYNNGMTPKQQGEHIYKYRSQCRRNSRLGGKLKLLVTRPSSMYSEIERNNFWVFCCGRRTEFDSSRISISSSTVLRLWAASIFD